MRSNLILFLFLFAAFSPSIASAQEKTRLMVSPPSPSLSIARHFIEVLKIPIGLQLKQDSNDLTLVHTFQLPKDLNNGKVRSAKLHLSMRPAPHGAIPTTDTFGFRAADPSGKIIDEKSWGRSMHQDFFPKWTREVTAFQEVDIDVSSLPNKNGSKTDLLPILNKDGEISFFISDDTEVQDIYLDVIAQDGTPTRLTIDLEKSTVLPPAMQKLKDHDVYFNSASAQLRPSDLSGLKAMIEFLGNNPDKKLKLGGYADYHGPQAYNQRLSQKRAEQVKTYLLKNGIDESRISDVMGHGELEKGREPDHKERRVSIEVVE